MALIVALLVAGCGGGSSATTGQLVRTHGLLVRVGGPAPGAPVALHGVDVHFQGSGGAADVRTDRHGRFAFDVAPGRYRVTITTGGPQADGQSIHPVPQVIHVPHAGFLQLVVNIR
ncbi:MAG TPA: hypothetical protein VGL44_05350 [Gaiellales bacterium]